jgi:chemotaxis protein methyltransferase CheR
VPLLVARPLRPLTFWSAGCSTGEEPYSLAMLLDDAGILDECLIVATDINQHALAKAERGIYRQNSFRQDGGGRPHGHITEADGGWCVDDRIRERVAFSRLNLARDPFPSFGPESAGIDLILCRNVLMYLDEASVIQIVERFVEALAPGGFIVTGPTDPPLWSLTKLEVVTLDAGVVYALPGSTAAQPKPRPRPNSGRRPRVGRAVSRPRVRQPNSALAVVSGPVVTDPAGSGPLLERAQAALAAGDWRVAGELTEGMASSGEAALHIRALHGVDRDKALAASVVAAERFPLSGEIHYLGATLHVCRGTHAEAILWLRRCVYVDRTLAIAHYLLGILLSQQGLSVAALRSLGRARTLCEALPLDSVVALGDGVTAQQLAEAASSHETAVAAEGTCGP